ncbi:hypothetical protein FACS1894158_05030 [Betaproteobacteria bacterium]|nr:hypothetical protein FACS1894158_05030 [Betaproteobacteria bacterium]
MTNPPPLEVLLRRLTETPRDFLDPPCVGRTGSVHVRALAFDLSHQLGEALSEAELRLFPDKPKEANWLTLCAIGCWLLSDESLRKHVRKQSLLTFLLQTLPAMAGEYTAQRYLLDPERREELARIALADLGLRPAGETEAQAQDRLQALSSIERRRIIAAARAAEKRAREIREALIRKAAAEAADKSSRE